MSVPLIFETGRKGRANSYFPNGRALDEFLPKSALRDDLPLPENSELDVVRHFTRLAQRTFSIDSGFYPLGSCTMKYNPRINEAMAALPGFRDLHPFSPMDLCQGALAATYDLQRLLSSIFGMAQFSLNPAAGAHAELAALLIAKAYFRDRGEERTRTTVIVPDTAHGTNPASAAMVGYKVRSLKSDERGRLSVEVLKASLGPDTAVCMMTNPNTLGLFEDHILEIAAAVHAAGGVMYYDGANANALMGNTRPGDMGFDLMHLNLHKTFSTPHGGGGPGSGPVACKAFLEPFLPIPILVQDENGPKGKHWNYDRPQSVGRVRAFYGNTGMFIRALAYILANGPDGLRQTTEDAVLNANYIRNKLEDIYDLPYKTGSMHEVVFSDKRQAALGVKTGDIAKRLIDYGFHPYTVSFPQIVHGALMIEPTESESLEELDLFIAAMRSIAKEVEETPELVKTAPHSTRISRLDEVQAARKPILRWREPA
jgi:glycine dehydrogenase subunit 2